MKMSAQRKTKGERAQLWLSALCLIVPALLTGCTGGIDQQELTTVLEDERLHQLPVAGRSVRIIKTESQKSNQWKVEYECTETAREAWCQELDSSRIEEEIASTVPAFDASIKQHTSVRWPEREPLIALKQKIDANRHGRMFRPVVRKGEETKWTATAVVKSTGDELQVKSTAVTSSQHEFADLSGQVEAETLGRVCDGSADDPVVKAKKFRQLFVNQLATQQKLVATRLKLEKDSLSTLLDSSRLLSGDLVLRARTAPVVDLRFEASATADKFAAVAIDQKDTFSRVVFDGAFVLPPTTPTKPRGTKMHDGWRLSLTNADPQLCTLARSVQHPLQVIFDTTGKSYQLVGQSKSSIMNLGTVAVEDSEDAPQLANLQASGVRLEGTSVENGMAEQEIAMTVTLFDKMTQNLRIVCEDARDPFNFAVFEGRCRTESPHHLGLPVKLKQVAYGASPANGKRKSAIFSSGADHTLSLLPSKSGYIGVFRNASLSFPELKQLNSIKVGPSRWEDALQSGSVWSGVSQWRNNAGEQISLRVAETRDEGKYVRLLLEKKDRPLDFVVYEGSWNQPDGRIDGYGLVTRQVGKNTNFDKEYYGVFFSVWEEKDPKIFRLSADGQTLYCLSQEGEIATLKKQPSERKPATYKTANMTKTWGWALSPGREWNGQYTNAKLGKTTVVTVKVLSYELDGKRVSVEITAAADARVKGVYVGSVGLADPAINGFALSLMQQKERVSQIALFDQGWEQSIEFRLDVDGEQLVGRSKNYQGLFSHMQLKLKPSKGEENGK